MHEKTESLQLRISAAYKTYLAFYRNIPPGKKSLSNEFATLSHEH
jgi:hypothetical protein